MDKIQARSEGLVSQKIGNEILIYDRNTNACHCLGAEVAFLWRSLEVSTCRSQLVVLFEQEFPQHRGRGEVLVDAGLIELSSNNLLLNNLSIRPLSSSRRKLLKAAGVAIFVASVGAPLPSAAQSNLLRISDARYWNNTVDVPTTQGLCGNLGNNAACNLNITAGLQALVTGGSVSAPCSNAQWTDPCTGTLKECRVQYTCGSGSLQTIRFCENATIVINC